MRVAGHGSLSLSPFPVVPDVKTMTSGFSLFPAGGKAAGSSSVLGKGKLDAATPFSPSMGPTKRRRALGPGEQ